MFKVIWRCCDKISTCWTKVLSLNIWASKWRFTEKLDVWFLNESVLKIKCTSFKLWFYLLISAHYHKCRTAAGHYTEPSWANLIIILHFHNIIVYFRAWKWHDGDSGAIIPTMPVSERCFTWVKDDPAVSITDLSVSLHRDQYVQILLLFFW